jgi:hypothetical protein
MMQEYQEEQNKPFMVDGEARKYMKADYEPDIKQPTDITYLVEIRNMYKAKVDAGNALKGIDTEIGKLDNEYKKLLSNINFYGITQQKYANKTKMDIYLLNNKEKIYHEI